jgi:hypothetical protein
MQEIKVTKQCKIKFVVSVDFIDEVELDVVPLDVCGVVFGSPYMYMRDAIFMESQPILTDQGWEVLHHQHT